MLLNSKHWRETAWKLSATGWKEIRSRRPEADRASERYKISQVKVLGQTSPETILI